MENNLIKSIKYLEGVNRIDDLINELLYSQDTGYINLISAQAVNGAQKVIEKFNYEADKIMREFEISNSNDIFREKQSELKCAIKKHYDKELFNWALEVFRNACNNIIFSASVNSENKDTVVKLFNRLKSAVEWYSNICNLSKDEANDIFIKLKSDFDKALISKDNDYLETPAAQISDFDLFIKLRNEILSDSSKYINTDFNLYKSELNKDDINYFQKLQNRMLINKTDTLDEENLINCAMDMLRIKNNSDKYSFIKQIKDEFLKLTPDTIQSKANIVKERIEMFKDSTNYLKKLLGF